MCDGWESVGTIAARVVEELNEVVGFGHLERRDVYRAQHPPTASIRVITLSADVDPGWSSAGPEEVAAAVVRATGVQRLPPFGVACHCRIGAGSDREEPSPPALAGRRREDARVQLKLVKVRAAPGVGTAREVRDSNCPIGSGPPIRPVIRANL